MAAITVLFDDEFVTELAARVRDAMAPGARASETASPEWAGTEPPADPWGQGPSGQNAPQTAPQATQSAPQPQRATSVPAPPAGNGGDAQGPSPYTGTTTVSTPKGLQVWTFAPPAGPDCNCGFPAAHVAGPGWSAYRCRKGSGDEWRTKCDFIQWLGKRR